MGEAAIHFYCNRDGLISIDHLKCIEDKERK